MPGAPQPATPLLWIGTQDMRRLVRPFPAKILLGRARLVVTRRRENGDAAARVAPTGRSANRAARGAGDRDVNLVQDLVGATLVRQGRDNGAALGVDDHRRRRRVAAEQDLVLRADCHSLRPGALVERDVEG